MTFSLLSPMIGIHIGRNPISGQRFMHVAPLPFTGIDFEFAPYVNDQHKENDGSDQSLVESKLSHGIQS
jgi:hypothetical protein